jgi:hypothetical protein
MEYSDEVLEKTPERATKFLTGLGAVATLRTLLAEAGMADDDIIEGRTLLLACLAAPIPRVVVDTEGAKAQRAAVAELDEWDEPNFARYSATLRRHHPDAGEFVFKELSASTGVAAVNGVATFLSRVAALASGSEAERKATRKEDKKAVELLAKRGLDEEERARLQALVDVALGPTAPMVPSEAAAAGDENRRKALTALKDWYEEWSTAARAVVKKRGYLIRLGLATRKSPTPKAKKKEGEGVGAPPK